MTTFAHCDTARPDGCYIQFARLIEPDDCAEPSWLENKRGRPSNRVLAYRRGEFEFVGVRAQARCLIVKDGVGTYINLESAGLWGTESDSGDDYLNEIYAQEIADLKGIIAAFANPTFEGETNGN
jgi:hypothetical protein